MNGTSEWVEPCLDAVRQRLFEGMRVPRATYRLQFRHDRLRFRDAAQLVPYLARLGISHVYASPYFKARAGSEHGYDIVDHSQLNPELGAEEDYQAFVDALRHHNMGHILDIVPNHMGVATSENRWWNNVLENGPSSPFAHYFDIDWRPIKAELRNKILLPLLGQQYGQVLESGQLQLEFSAGVFVLRYFETKLPIEPKSYGTILRFRLDQLREMLGADSEATIELESILTALDYLPETTETEPERVAERQREKEVIKGRLQRLVDDSPAIAEFIAGNIATFNGTAGQPQSFDLLDELLESQVYRLSHWKAASDEINYRRFFDINELAAVSMEEPDVFAEAHHLAFQLLADERLDGLRIDHIDGLYDPTDYLWRLQWGYLEAVGRREFERLVPESVRQQHRFAPLGAGVREGGTGLAAAGEDATEQPASDVPEWEEIEPRFRQRLRELLCDQWPATAPVVESEVGVATRANSLALSADWRWKRLPLYVVAEKILEQDEDLPKEWPVAGTTGYDFLNLASGLFVSGDGLRQITRYYQRFTDNRTSLQETMYLSKRLILRVAMSSELQLLATQINRLSEQHRRYRDFTLNNLRTALRELLSCFPVYRTYIHGAVSERDRKLIHVAAARAKRLNPAINAALFDFIRDTLLLELPPQLDDAGRQLRTVFVGRFQQVSSPVMAKGAEDTAFYRYFPLASLNEVGGSVEREPVTPETFHQENRLRLAQRPGTLLTSTTHDAKRSEDVRARIHVLSEIPNRWRKAVSRWARINRRHRQEVDGEPAPSRNDEYLFYQSLVGIWPMAAPDEAAHEQIVERLQSYMEKATHEAKLRTSWINPNPDYDAAVKQFVAAALAPKLNNRFLRDFGEFHEQVLDSGLFTALSQLLLKLTSPGVPDIYQGQEIWDFSLVDPDNRRPVDFSYREGLLTEMEALTARSNGELTSYARGLADQPRDDRLKLYVTWRTLRHRQQYARLYAEGEYVPLEVVGSKSDHICAYAWRRPRGDTAASDTVVVAVPRMLAGLTIPPLDQAAGPPKAPRGAEVWGDTAILLGDFRFSHAEQIFTGERIAPANQRLSAAQLFESFPVCLAVLHGE